MGFETLFARRAAAGHPSPMRAQCGNSRSSFAHRRGGCPVPVDHDACQRRMAAKRLSDPVRPAAADLVLEMARREQAGRYRDWLAGQRAQSCDDVGDLGRAAEA